MIAKKGFPGRGVSKVLTHMEGRGRVYCGQDGGRRRKKEEKEEEEEKEEMKEERGKLEQLSNGGR